MECNQVKGTFFLFHYVFHLTHFDSFCATFRQFSQGQESGTLKTNAIILEFACQLVSSVSERQLECNSLPSLCCLCVNLCDFWAPSRRNLDHGSLLGVNCCGNCCFMPCSTWCHSKLQQNAINMEQRDIKSHICHCRHQSSSWWLSWLEETLLWLSLFKHTVG